MDLPRSNYGTHYVTQVRFLNCMIVKVVERAEKGSSLLTRLLAKQMHLDAVRVKHLMTSLDLIS